MDSINKNSLLSVGDFYGDRYIWRVIEENGLISLTPKANRKILKVRLLAVFIISIFVYFAIHLLTALHPIEGLKYYFVMALPLAIILFGVFGLLINAYLENKDIRLGPTLIADMKSHKIVLPREHLEFQQNSSTHLQLITDTATESKTIYEMNLVHQNKRYPLLRALNPFVFERAEELAKHTGLKIKTYQSSTKASYYQVATGGR